MNRPGAASDAGNTNRGLVVHSGPSISSPLDYCLRVSRILVAEDDPKQAALIRMYLEREGHSLHVVADGRAALDVCRAYRPDLAVLDIMMPVVDGLDVCRILRAESDMPILLLTARTTTEDMLLGLDIGADDYMTKPYN